MAVEWSVRLKQLTATDMTGHSLSESNRSQSETAALEETGQTSHLGQCPVCSVSAPSFINCSGAVLDGCSGFQFVGAVYHSRPAQAG